MNRRERHVEKVEKRCSIAPITTMPPEILSLILELYCAQHWLYPTIPPPVSTVSAVCGRWKQISESMPGLWSCINIDFDLWEDEEDRRLPHVVQVFMDKSKTSLLTITLCASEETVYYPFVPLTMKTFVKYSSRWFSLDLFNTPDPFIRHHVFEAISGRLPRLKHLDLGADIDGVSLDPFADAPVLHSVSYRPACCVHVVDKLPLEQLRVLELWLCFSYTAVLPLKRCGNVRVLTLFCVGGYANGHDNAHVDVTWQVNMPSVKTLKVVTEDEHHISFVFRHLLLSQCSSFEISCVNRRCAENWTVWDDIINIPYMRTFFHRWSCNITSLRLEDLPASDTQIIDFLSFMPKLQSLYIKDRGQALVELPNRLSVPNRTVTSTFLWGLTVEEGSSVLVPLLRELTLVVRLNESDDRHTFDFKSLMGVMLSRRKPCALTGVDSLQSVVVRLMGAIKLPEELESPGFLQDVREQLRISVV